MRRLLFIFQFVFFAGLVAQNADSSLLKLRNKRFFIGIGSGINAHTGYLGLSGELLIRDQMFLRGGLGFSNWGYKLSGALKVQKAYKSSFGIALGYSYVSGIKNVLFDLETDRADIGNSNNGIVTITEVRKVNMDLLPASVLSVAASYNWLIKKRHRIYLELSYGLKTPRSAYKPKNLEFNAFERLSSKSQTTMDILQPGGVGFSFGYMFGF
jgi:hypothetical protein